MPTFVMQVDSADNFLILLLQNGLNSSSIHVHVHTHTVYKWCTLILCMGNATYSLDTHIFYYVYKTEKLSVCPSAFFPRQATNSAVSAWIDTRLA